MNISAHFTPYNDADAKCSDGSSNGQGYFVEFTEEIDSQWNKDYKMTANDFRIFIKIRWTLLKFLTKFDLKMKLNGKIKRIAEPKIQADVVKSLEALFDDMFHMFPVELAAIMDYMEFRDYYKQILIGSRDLLEKLMSKKHTNPEVYITAAIYQYSIRLDFDKAGRYFKLGIKNHKKCEALYIEYFWMEIQLMEKQDNIHFCTLLKKYQKCIKNFKNDLQFHLQVLEKLILCNSNKAIQNFVISDIKAKFASEISFDGQQMLYKTFENGIKETKSIKKRRNLWNLYVDYVTEAWKRVFRGANKNEAPQEYYVYLAEYCTDDNQAIFKEVIEMNKNNPEVWADFILTYNSPIKSITIKDGIQTLKEDSFFWEMMCSFLENNKGLGEMTFFGNDKSLFYEEK